MLFLVLDLKFPWLQKILKCYLFYHCSNILSGVGRFFSVKEQIVNIFGFVSHTKFLWHKLCVFFLLYNPLKCNKQTFLVLGPYKNKLLVVGYSLLCPILDNTPTFNHSENGQLSLLPPLCQHPCRRSSLASEEKPVPSQRNPDVV